MAGYGKDDTLADAPAPGGYGAKDIAVADIAAPGFVPTIKRTAGQMLTTAATTAEDITGPNRVTQAVSSTGQGIIDRNPAGITGLGDILESPWLTVKESVGQFVPQIGAAAAGAGAGAMVGRRIAGAPGAAVGAGVGGLAPIFTQEYGGIRQDQQESGQESIPRALAAAGAASALERVGMGKVLKGIANPGAVAMGGIPAEIGKGVLREGLTEAAQTSIEQLGAFKDPTTRESLGEAGLAGVMGGIGGGVVAGGQAGLSKALGAPDVAAADPADPVTPLAPAGDPLRTATLPDTGPMSRAINLGIEGEAQAADIGAPTPAPIAGGLAGVPDGYAPLPLPVGEATELDVEPVQPVGSPSVPPVSGSPDPETGELREKPVFDPERGTIAQPERASFPTREAVDQYLSQARINGGVKKGKAVPIELPDGKFTFVREGEPGYEKAEALAPPKPTLAQRREQAQKEKADAKQAAAPVAPAAGDRRSPDDQGSAGDAGLRGKPDAPLEAVPGAGPPAGGVSPPGRLAEGAGALTKAPNLLALRRAWGDAAKRSDQAAMKSLGDQIDAIKAGLVAPSTTPQLGEPDVQGQSTQQISTQGTQDAGAGVPASPSEGRLPDAQDGAQGPGQVSSIDAAAGAAAPSPTNDRRPPTEGEKKAGNYAKGHDDKTFPGLDLSIENDAGSERSGVDRDGKAWTNTLRHHYGYIKGSVGNDKDHVDVFVKPGTPEGSAGTVFVVDQVHPDTGKFDEHKVLLGFADLEEAKAAYAANYAKDWKGLKAISAMPFDEFKAWVFDGPKNKPLAPGKAAPASRAAAPAQDAPVLDNGRGDTASKAAATADELVEHVTGKGKTIRGVWRDDLSERSAKAIDPYSFNAKGKGWFIREKHVDKMPVLGVPVAAVDGEPTLRARREARRGEGPVTPQLPPKESGPEIPVSETGQDKPEPVVSANTVFTADAAAKAREVLRKKLGPSTLRSGIDPEILQAGITLAGYHIERGARTFAAYAKAMVDDLGNGVKPYLKSWYMGVKYDPRAAGWDMDGAAAVESANVDANPDTGPAVEKSASNADTPTEDTPDGPAPRPLDSASGPALAGAPAAPVPGAETGGDAGGGVARSSTGDSAGHGEPAQPGDRSRRGVGDGAGAPPVPARGAGRERADRSEPRLPRAPRRRTEPGLFDDAGREGTPAGLSFGAASIAPPQFQPADFRIEDDLALGEGGQKAKFRGNVDAIRLLREIDASGRQATPAEQRTLARYVGWGGLSQAFDAQHKDWGREHAELKALLTADEFAAAMESTQYAHYTSREIIGGVYAALARLGFSGGKIMEAGAGVGHFIGLMPEGLRSASRFTGIEREPISAGIARHLYPRQNIQQADFAEFIGNDGYFDAAIGNPPFARTALTDQSGRKHLTGLSVHNYFFAKAVDMLREGGILAQVVSNPFLDAKRDNARRYIADRVEFLGAIRLPNNAFAKNANTEVTTDVVFLKKLPESQWAGRAGKDNRDTWLDVVPVKDAKGGEDILVNAYFAAHPEMMLGTLGRHGTMYGPDMPALVAKPGQDTPALMRAAIERLPKDAYTPAATANTEALKDRTLVALQDKSVQEGGHYVEGGKLYQRLQDAAGEARAVQITPDTQWTEKTKLGQGGFDRIVGLAQIRATLRALLAAEMAGDKAMVGLRKTLNMQYDAYTAEHGLINDKPSLRVFDDDPDFPLIASLEHGFTPSIGLAAARTLGIKPVKATASKAPIFSKRVVDQRAAPTRAESPADALNITLAERGRIDARYIGELLGKGGEDALKDMASGEKPLLFIDPATGEYALRDAYLSGNVRAKLEQARQAGLFDNVRALEAVQPQDVGAHEISVRLGSPWVPTEVYESFATHLFGEGAKASIRYLKANSSYSTSVSGGSQVAMTNTWGTPDYSGPELLTAILNNRDIKVTYLDEERHLRTDAPKTEAANLKASEIRQAFQDWAFRDSVRSELLAKTYNETNNNYVTRAFDGGYMSFPGKVPDDVIKFRRHQRNAIARIVQDRTALLDHVVGAGKTYTVVSAAMELKRTGLANKPMVIVPNHLVKQWATDFYRLYPAANVLTATKKDFEKLNRRKFLAKIATGNWDAVVMAHSSFGFIRPSPEFEERFNQQQIKGIVDTIQAVEEQEADPSAKKRTVKQLAALKERLENRIDALRQKPIDSLLDFQQIGVDQLFVDEAHLFKNLMFTTKMQNVRGLGDAKGSQRAYDLFIKTHQVYDQNGRGQGVVFATGTPVSNSLAEMYHMMRYLMPEAMRNAGFESFDAWANTFASVEQTWMQKFSGDGFKADNRMSTFVNTPELLKFFDQVADTVTMEDIKGAFRVENPGKEFPLPALKTGRRQPVSLTKSDAQNAFMAEIAARAKAIEGKRTNVKGMDNALRIMGDARKAAMDIRLVDPNITAREKGGRIDRAASEIQQRHEQWASVKGAQLVFSDLGTPIKHAKTEMKEWEAFQSRIGKGVDPTTVTAANLGNEASMALVDDAEAAQNELDAMGADWLDAVKAALRGFSIYDDLKAALIERGIPEREIAFIHDYNTDEQKASLFRKVNAGDIRVLMGSTPKLGAGTNVQERLVALHHLDVPWKPSDVEQREGRILRQGNRLQAQFGGFEVEVLAYVTQDTLDMRMWQIQEAKLKMINQLRARQIGREVDNAFEDMEMSAGEMQAAATGNMDLLREIQLRTDVKKLEQAQRSYVAQRGDLETRRRRAEQALKALPPQIEQASKLAALGAAYEGEQEAHRAAFKATVNGVAYTDAREAGAVLHDLVEAKVYRSKADGKKAEITREAFEALPKDEREGWTAAAAPLDVEFNGERYTARNALGEAFAELRGDVDPPMWKVDGQTHTRRTQLAKVLAQRVIDATMDERQTVIGSIGQYKVEVEGQPVDRMGRHSLEVTLSAEGQTQGASIGVTGDGTEDSARKAATYAVNAAMSMAKGSSHKARYLTEDLARAQKALVELDKAGTMGDWPGEAKLAAARQTHREVLARLSAADKPADAQPADDATADDGTAFNRVDDGKQQPDTGSRGQPDNSLDARRNIGLLERAIARHIGRAGAGDEVHPYVGTRLPAFEELGAVAAAFGSRVQGFGLSPDLLAADRERFGFFNGVRTGGVVFLRDGGNDRPHFAVLGHELGHELRTRRPDLYDQLVEAIRPYVDRAKYPEFVRLAVARNAGSRDKQREEFIGEVLSDGFMDREFWRALGNKNPGLLREIGDMVMRLVETVLRTVGYTKRSEPYLTDYKRVMQLAGEVMAEFAGNGFEDTVPGVRDMRFNAIDTLRSAATARGLSELYHDATTSQRGFNRWWHRTVGTQYHKAQINPDFKRVFDRAQDYLHDTNAFSNDAAEYAKGILPQLKSWRDMNKSLKPRDAQALSGPVFEGTLRYERAADGTLQESGDVGSAGVVFSDAELETLYGLTPLQRSLYRQFRASVDRSLDLLVAADVARDIGTDLPPAMKRMVSDGDTGRFKGLVAAMLQQQIDANDADSEAGGMWRALQARVEAKYQKIESLKARGYAPLMRFGQYAVHVVRQGAAQQTEFFGLYESQRQANEAARSFRTSFAGEPVDVQQGVMPEQAYKLFSGMTPETLEVFADVAGVERNEAFQAYLKLAASNRSALKRLIHRKGVKGYNEDAGRVLAQFITSNARAGAGALHLGDMALAIGDMQERKVAGDVIDEAIKLREYVQNPVEEAQAIRGLLFAQYLGGSVASAAVNMTQPLTMTFPYLSQFGGAIKAALRLTSAIKQAVSTIDPASELGRALTKAEKEGIVSPQEIHQLQGEAMRRAGNNQWVKKGLFVWGSLFSLAEQFNRRSTFIAAWNTAREERIDNPFAFAVEAVDQTQGVYNKANKPNWARGALGSTVFTFKQYSISYIEFLKRLPPKERALALGVLLLMAGLQGLPGADDLDDLIDTIAQQLGYDLQSKEQKRRFLAAVLGEGGADFMLRGFSAIPGFPLDLAGRLSVGNLIPGTGMLLKSREDKAREVAEVIGPVAGLATDAMKAIERRDPSLVVPSAIRNLLKGLEMGQTGQYRDTSGRKVRDVDTLDAVVKGVGFQPSAVARDSRAMQTQRQKVQLARTVESEVAAQWAAGIVDREVDKVRAARDRLHQWNVDNPESRIAITGPQVARRVQEMRMTRDERAIKAAPKELRAGVREALAQ